MKKKTLSGLLAICMVVAMLPTQAFASTGNLPVATQDVNVTSTVEEDTPETTPPPTPEPTPTPPPEPTPTVVDAVASVLARIRALPTMDDIEAQKPESEEFSGYLAALRADIAAARGAYDALTDEQKATVDDDVLAKLTELELMLAGVLAATTMAAGDAITITVTDGTTSETGVGGTTLQAAVEASSIAATAITALTITAGKVTTEDWVYISDLKALTNFTIADDAAVTSVDAIPDDPYDAAFPTTIVTVTIPQAIGIGKMAFKSCTVLTTATIPAATSIGDSAFYSCTALTTATIPAATTIGDLAFNRCAKLTPTADSFKMVKTIGANAFEVCVALTIAEFPKATSIGDNAFKGCILLVTTSFPAAISIGNSAFNGCAALTTVAFPEATTISKGAFDSCKNLETISFPKVTVIGNGAFNECAELKDASFPLVTKVGVPPGDREMDGNVFNSCKKLTKADFPLAEIIREASFKGCTLLAVTSFPKVTEIGVNAFNGCKALEIASFSAATTIGTGAFNGCVALTSATFPAATTIGASAFTNCKLTTTATFPAATIIGANAFSGCALTAASFPAAKTIGDSAFSGCQLTTASFPAATSIGDGAFNGCTLLATASFPAATTIGASAFNGCVKLTTLKLGATVPTVANANAFNGIATTRSLVLMKADGTTELTGNVLNTARKSYDGVATGGTASDGLWYGWTLPAQVAVESITITTPPNKTAYTAGQTFDTTGMVVTATYVGGSKAVVEDCTYSPNLGTALAISNNKVKVSYTAGDATATADVTITVTAATTPPTPPTPPTGGGGGGSGSTTTAGNVIDKPVGSSGSVNPLAAAAKTAVAASKASTTSYVNYTNYQALTKDGLKAINDAAAAAVKGTKLQLNTKVQLDSSIGGIVTSRITVDPAKLTVAMPNKLGLKVWFDQKVDTKVIAVNNTFDKYFTNKLVTITFEEVAPLSVSMVLALKPDLSGLNVKNLHFYSYNPTTNLYSRIATPSYWVDRNGYSHITAPLGGSIIITDRPLTRK